MFHGVEPEPLSPPCWHVLDAATLRRQLDYVRRVFSVLPLEEALDRLRRGTLPDHAAVITFDDGTQNLLTQAAPILRDLAAGGGLPRHRADGQRRDPVARPAVAGVRPNRTARGGSDGSRPRPPPAR
jgi:hypothetical protein